jgi:hypothetical protein
VDGGNASQWAVSGDGSLVGRGAAAGQHPEAWTHLLGAREYGDFRLRFDFQPAEDTAGGCLDFAAEPGEKFRLGNQDGAYHPCLSLALPGAMLWSPATAFVPARQTIRLRGPGQWNNAEVTLKGRRLRAAINGVETTDNDLDQVAPLPGAIPGFRRTSGRIGLGVMAGEVRFRNVRIRELSPADAGPGDDAPRPAPKRFPVGVKTPAGKWYAVGDTVIQSTTDPNSSLQFGDLGWTDYDYSVDFQRLRGGDQVVLHFNQNRERKHGYMFGLGTFRNVEHSLEIWADGKLTMPFQTPRVAHALENGRWYTARVSVRGGNGECFLNGVRIFAYKNHPVRPGMVGLRTWASPFAFRNIRVTAPDGAVLLEGLPDVVNGEPRR